MLHYAVLCDVKENATCDSSRGGAMLRYAMLCDVKDN